jgi:hypothetical protein
VGQGVGADLWWARVLALGKVFNLLGSCGLGVASTVQLVRLRLFLWFKVPGTFSRLTPEAEKGAGR